MSKSEVARLLTQIEQEYQASKRGLEGFASGTARHDFIQTRTENIGHCHRTSRTGTGYCPDRDHYLDAN
jgi:hypothetical protein